LTETVVGIIRFGFSLLFGIAVSVLFAGIERTRRNMLAVRLICVIFLLIQSACWWFFGIETTSKLYPLIIHLPLILIFTIYFKRPLPISAASTLSAYLCCQAPRWVGFLAGAAVGSRVTDHICYIAAVLVAYYLLRRYVAESIKQFMERSVKSCLLLGAVPFFYYIFDYITTIYTDMLYSGAKWAVQFMPSITSIFYFVFIILYYSETQKQVRAQRERDILASQLHMAKAEFETLRQMHNYTAVYRHDMRHHISFLKALAAENNIDKIKDYLKTAEQDMAAITPVRFCENETLNLILSSFSTKAKQAAVAVKADIRLPSSISISDTELCSLLSNGLENAITASSACANSNNKIVSVVAAVHKAKLLISIENPYEGQIVFKDGLPQASLDGHGYGARSIAAIAESHNGQAIFDAEGGIFKLKLMLPLNKQS
jgi:hypothetical protein